MTEELNTQVAETTEQESLYSEDEWLEALEEMHSDRDALYPNR
jgi:hypothetical protein